MFGHASFRSRQSPPKNLWRKTSSVYGATKDRRGSKRERTNFAIQSDCFRPAGHYLHYLHSKCGVQAVSAHYAAKILHHKKTIRGPNPLRRRIGRAHSRQPKKKSESVASRELPYLPQKPRTRRQVRSRMLHILDIAMQSAGLQ